MAFEKMTGARTHGYSPVLHLIGYHSPCLDLRASFLPLTQIQLSFTDSPDIQALHPNVRMLTLSETGQTSNPFHSNPHHLLESLTLDGMAIDNAMAWNNIELPNLHNLLLRS